MKKRINVTPAVYIVLSKKAYYNVMRFKKGSQIRGKREAIIRMLESCEYFYQEN